LNVSTHWSAAADVKKTDPTKKTSASVPDPTSSTKPGNGPIRKQSDPIAKRTPIHHAARRGAHQAPSSSGAGRETLEACLRWVRDDQWVTPPSGRR
jgi:hypothetical protein